MYFPALDLAGRLQKKITKNGLDLRYSQDLHALKKHACRMGFEDEITPHFDPEKFDILDNQQFWLGVFNGKKCVGMVACKRQPLGNTSLIEYVNQSWKRYYGHSSVKLSSKQRRIVKQLRGNLIYQGEFRIDKKLRSKGLGEALCSLARIVGFFQWNDSDWWYCFLKEKDWNAGIDKMVQATSHFRQVLAWDCPPDPIVDDYVLGLMDVSNYHDWVDERLEREIQSLRKK